MPKIGGNTEATMQVNRQTEKNAIGERVREWFDVVKFTGWLDLSGGDSKYTTYSAKIQESTHLFMCDFQAFEALSKQWEWDPFSFLTGIINPELDENIEVTSENARLMIGGKVYDIMLIDDPMNLHQHLEIYLKYVGGQNAS